MFGSIQDTTRRGRRMMLWIVFLALCFIDNVLATKPVDAKLTIAATSAPVEKVSGAGKYYQTTGTLDLTCAATCAPACSNNLKYQFLKDGNEIATPVSWAAWTELATRTALPALDASTAGSYSCKARDGDTIGDTSEASPPLLLTLTAGTDTALAVSMTAPPAPQDPGSTAVGCTSSDNPTTPKYQYVKTAPGQVKVVKAFGTGGTSDTLTFDAQAAGKYACMVVDADGKMGISTEVAILFKCDAKGDCTGTGDANADCTDVAGTKRCTCPRGGIFSGSHATCNAPLTTPKVKRTGMKLTCTPAAADNCGDSCTFEWYLHDSTDKVIDGEVGADYVVPRNGVYRCLTVRGQDRSPKSSDNSGEGVVTQLPKTPCITLPAKGNCGAAVMITCKAGGETDCTSGDGDTTAAMGVGNDTNVAEIGKGAYSTPKLEIPVIAINGKVWCVAHTATSGGLASISVKKPMTCDGASSSVAPNPDSTSNGGGGVDTTKSDNKGDDSGASDLGRPASVLTIVCSLLTLTLNLRG